MKHEEAMPSVVEFFHGRLSAEDRKALLAHLDACEECRGLRSTYELLLETCRQDEMRATGEHPSVDSVVSYALGAEALDEEEISHVEEHLESCQHCAREVKLTREGERRLAPEGAPLREAAAVARPAYRVPVWAGLAAAFLLPLLAYTVYVRLFEVPTLVRRNQELTAGRVEADRQIQALREAAGYAGPMDIVYLTGARRGAIREEAVFRVAPGQPFVPFVVDPVVSAGDRDILRLEIFQPDESVVWSDSGPASRFEPFTHASGTVQFMVPATRLSPGPYMMVVTHDRDGEKFTVDYPFRLEPLDSSP